MSTIASDMRHPPERRIALQLNAAGEPAGLRLPRWVVPAFALLAGALVPWVFLLAKTLPTAHNAPHWRIAWIGFDLGLAAALAAVAVAAYRRSPWLEGAAMAAAALLLCDAWFDVLSATTLRELGLASAEAVVVELPLAVLCLLVARRAEHSLVRSLVDRALSERERTRDDSEYE